MSFLQISAYVNATEEIDLRFVCGSGLILYVYAEAADSAASNGRRSVSGVAFILGDTDTCWKSGTQKCSSTSNILVK